MIDKNLFIVCGTLSSGGAERVIATLSTPFADSFKNITLITWREAPHFYTIDSRVKLISLPKLAESNSDWKKGLIFRTLVKTQKPDIVLSFLTLFNLFVILSLIGIKVPIVSSERNDPRFIKGGAIMKAIRNVLYRKSTGILCQTEAIKNYFKNTLRKKCHIIYNPVIMSNEMVGSALTMQKKNKIVSVGRLHSQKNHKLLIESFKIFHDSHPEYSLIIYGTGDLKEETKEYVKRVGLENFIILAGEQKKVKELILDAKVFVMTSLYEGMPNALIEAMCLGLPCISTKVSGATDLISDGENGYLVDFNSVEIAEKISYIVDNNNIAKKIGSSAKNLYDQLNVKKISKSWIEYISILLNATDN